MAHRPSLPVIFLTVFIDLVGFGICLPLLPKYAERYGAGGWKIGAVLGVYSLMQLLFAPWWGQLSDRIGRRPVLLVSTFGSAASYALFGLSARFSGETGVCILALSRVFAGICGANLSVASAYIADVTTAENRSRGMGMIGMAFGLGFILGPVLGGLAFQAWGLPGPGWTAAAICAANFALAWFVLAESRAPGGTPAARRPRAEQIRHVLGRPGVGFLVGVYFLATFSFTVFETTLTLLLSRKLGYDERQASYVFAYCGFAAALVQGGGVGRLVKSFGEARLVGASLLVAAASLAAMPFVASAPALLVVFAAGSGINRAPTMGLISRLSPDDEQGATLGVAQSAGTLARVVGPLTATSLFALWVPAPYLFCAGVATIAGLLALRRLLGSAAPKL
jgi:MFS family permease